ncbi:hypothetical protein WBG78_07700 [Chryseolinea sp. T2]|uniref:hypothetical protein n=1 Tax=Chryseolinea sp. T2 TaxID=3129255 RepID=UPI003077BB88
MKTNLRLVFAACFLFVSVTLFAQRPSPALLTPTNHTLVLTDNESQMAFAVANIPVYALRNNTAMVAGASKLFSVPTVVTTVAEKSFSGPVFPEVEEFYPKATSNYFPTCLIQRHASKANATSTM